MMHGRMTHSEMLIFCAHIQEMALQAGHAMNDVQRFAPERCKTSLGHMMAATRIFYRATQRFMDETAALMPEESQDDAQCHLPMPGIQAQRKPAASN